MVSLIVFGLAVALFIVHLIDGRVPRSYVAAAFIMSSIVAAGDLREPAGQTCVTAVTDSGDTRTVCAAQYAVKVEALAAFVASVGFAMLALFFEFAERLGRAALGGWDV
ncbi:MAG: hypothetical protein ACO2PM_07060 [Pyrobaculum sp.]